MLDKYLTLLIKVAFNKKIRNKINLQEKIQLLQGCLKAKLLKLELVEIESYMPGRNFLQLKKV